MDKRKLEATLKKPINDSYDTAPQIEMRINAIAKYFHVNPKSANWQSKLLVELIMEVFPQAFERAQKQNDSDDKIEMLRRIVEAMENNDLDSLEPEAARHAKTAMEWHTYRRKPVTKTSAVQALSERKTPWYRKNTKTLRDHLYRGGATRVQSRKQLRQALKRSADEIFEKYPSD